MEIKVIKPSVQYIHQAPGLEGMYEQIEKCGRNCYRSKFNGGAGSIAFTDAMVKSGHTAMIEHGTVYLKLPVLSFSEEPHPVAENPHSRLQRVKDIKHNIWDYVTTNYRVIIENGWEDLLQCWCEPTRYHARRATVLFDTNIGISREFNRHRVNSMAESSTRYCNYTKDKFTGSITTVLPTWLRDQEYIINIRLRDEDFSDQIGDLVEGNGNEWGKFEWWLFAMETCNLCYSQLIKLGCKPEEAREVLPLATNTQLIHTAFVDDWEHFFSLRADNTPTNHPHPMAMELAQQWREVMKEYGLLE